MWSRRSRWVVVEVPFVGTLRCRYAMGRDAHHTRKQRRSCAGGSSRHARNMVMINFCACICCLGFKTPGVAQDGRFVCEATQAKRHKRSDTCEATHEQNDPSLLEPLREWYGARHCRHDEPFSLPGQTGSVLLDIIDNVISLCVCLVPQPVVV